MRLLTLELKAYRLCLTQGKDLLEEYGTPFHMDPKETSIGM